MKPIITGRDAAFKNELVWDRSLVIAIGVQPYLRNESGNNANSDTLQIYVLCQQQDENLNTNNPKKEKFNNNNSDSNYSSLSSNRWFGLKVSMTSSVFDESNTMIYQPYSVILEIKKIKIYNNNNHTNKRFSIVGIVGKRYSHQSIDFNDCWLIKIDLNNMAYDEIFPYSKLPVSNENSFSSILQGLDLSLLQDNQNILLKKRKIEGNIDDILNLSVSATRGMISIGWKDGAISIYDMEEDESNDSDGNDVTATEEGNIVNSHDMDV